MVSSFYASKPVERLLGTGIKAENLSDNILGKVLDAIHEYGQTKRLDSTSITVCGDYADSDSGIDIIYGSNRRYL